MRELIVNREWSVRMYLYNTRHPAVRNLVIIRHTQCGNSFDLRVSGDEAQPILCPNCWARIPSKTIALYNLMRL